MKIRRIDHVGIIVNDLPAAKAFFLDLGLEMLGQAEVEGEWVERIIGLRDVREEVVMLRTPDGEANIELVKFHSPSDRRTDIQLIGFSGVSRSGVPLILIAQKISRHGDAKSNGTEKRYLANFCLFSLVTELRDPMARFYRRISLSTI